MRTSTILFPSGTTEYCFAAGLADLREKAQADSTVIITDAHVAALHGAAFSDYRVLTVPAGEASKTWETIERLVKELVALGAHRNTMLLGIGGGLVTDITGFLASVYMRGLRFAYAPTTLLGMVDAAVGGKNGVNVGLHKNMMGTVRQPAFILYHMEFLDTLPDEEWSNGFAEIIKYGYIADVRILSLLRNNDIRYFQRHRQALAELVEGCVAIKNKIVMADEQEQGIRKYLNFGHTAGHALETLYHLPHGHAVGLGMLVAVHLSARYRKLDPGAYRQLGELLTRYLLPVSLDFEPEAVLALMLGDKKRLENGIDYVLLEKPGVACTCRLDPEQIRPELRLENPVPAG